MRIVTFGEGMLEIAGHLGADARIAQGGDALNVTVALARLGLAPMFMTALGVDAWSDEMLAAWDAEGVDCSLVARHPTRVPGLYAIRTDDRGERSFTYWRDRSAVRDFFALPGCDALLDRAAAADLLFLSGITLSLFDDAGRDRIARVAERVRGRGGMVAFDGNYRPRGWATAPDADRAFAAFAPHATVALPSLEDEALLHGPGETPEIVARRWHRRGVPEVAVKLGVDGAHLSWGEGTSQVPVIPAEPMDTSGAGDAFDAGYLAARLAGHGPVTAARHGHALARITVCHRGAIPTRLATAAFRIADIVT